MRRSALLVAFGLLAAGCKKDPPKPMSIASARALETGPAKVKFGDQTRPKVDMTPRMAPPRERTPEEWRTAFDKVCHEEGRCDKYLVAAEIQAAPEPMAKELTKRCWDARKAATTRVRSFATELAKIEVESRRAAYHGTPGCVDAARSSNGSLAKMEQTYGKLDPDTPERSDMRAALDAVGKCHACDAEHVSRCDVAKRLILELQRTAAGKQDAYCKDLLKPAGSSK